MLLKKEDRFTEINKQVKTLHTLLNELDPETRIVFIREMLPALLTFTNGNAVSAQEKLHNKMQNPVQELSPEDLKIISGIAKKTEELYNNMNNRNYFG